ncbi:acyltransferase family protein [Microbacterium sp. ISL-103]|jgi:fucose 4-O-acetylase-like acetyltransferase|uniref:acyltransferase family protein n=1 Tax=Microbacterium sp. ISL-103 TaxID=2819156 RepID=UPI001BE6A466|nr:acyltransferase family protein [Microbacterium sp. ISL-103]MBT2475703.1 acyltransferase family protein [Microbacterium sp. ISL-103]
MSSAATESTIRTVPEGRDLTLDLARVVCVVLVVFVHILFTGVGRAPDGSLLIERTVEAQSWFTAASWVANIMPLFFVVGGYAARAGWRSAVARGESADSFVRVRLVRLARPALPLFVFLSAALGATRMLGIDPALVDTVAIGVGSPLWFLAAYMIVQAAAPTMMRMHERFGAWVLLVLLAGAVLIDTFRFTVIGGFFGIQPVAGTGYGLGQELFGIPNIVFVWLFAQQVGFFLFDGWFAQRRWWQLVLLMAAGYGALWGLVSVGGYSWNMLGNQWPPTTAMTLLAVIQASALTLLHAPLTALMRHRGAQGVVFVIGSRLMTVYLWHLPMIMVLIGIQLLLPIPLPAPGSAVWWWTRPLFLLVVLGAVWLLSLWLIRFEKSPARGIARFPSPGATVSAVLLFIAPIIAITAYGLDFPLAAAALVCTAMALWLTGSRRDGRG